MDQSLAQSEAAVPPLTDNLSGGSKPERFLFFSGVDLWRNGQAAAECSWHRRAT